MNRRASLVFAVLMLSCAAAYALEEDQNQPIELSADSADLDEGKGLSIYRGDVDVRQGSMRLQADVLTVYHTERRPTRMVAEGQPARFEQLTSDGLVKGQSRRLEYEMQNENLQLIGDAIVFQGQDVMRSDRITYDRARGQVKAGAAAQGKQRVRISIQPDSR